MTILSFSNIHEHGPLFLNFMRERKKVFIDRLGWELPHSDGMEFDQYDTPNARYIIQHEGDKVLGGMRLIPTTSQVGVYSYMMRDAQQGRLDSLPCNLLNGVAPVNEHIWECTRVFISEGIPNKQRRAIQFSMVQSMIELSREQFGATSLLAITHHTWFRWYPRRGINATPIGPVMTLGGDKFQCIEITTEIVK